MLTYKNKIFIDRTFGFIAAFLLKYLTRLVGIILRRDHTLPDNPQVIAVAKIIGLGSIIYTGILCRSLKKRFPDSKLIYITSSGSFELVKRMNYIDDILLINDKDLFSMIKSTGSLILKLWRYRPVLYFDMEVYSSWAAIIATLSLALNRYGFYRNNAEFKKGMHSHLFFFNARRHIADIYSQMALCIGATPDTSLSGIINVSDEDRKICSDILSGLDINNSMLSLVNVNSSDLLIERRWPEEKWKEYLEQSVRLFPGTSFLLTGSTNERKYVRELYNTLSQGAREKVFNGAGLFPFGAFLALIERSTFMVTNDSGPMHFAIALRIPTISIWGPVGPEHYAPQTGNHIIIYKSICCSPCFRHADFPPCEGNNICVKNIEVISVLNATKEIINSANNENCLKSPLTLSLNNDKDSVSSGGINNFIPVIRHKKSKKADI